MDGYSTDKLSARLITKQGPKNPNLGWGFFMPRDGQYVAKSQEGGATNAQGWTVCRKEPGRRCDECPGMGGILQGARKAVRRMSMDGRAENCSCIFRTPHFHVGRFCKEPGWRCDECPGEINQMRSVNSPLRQPLQTTLPPTRRWNCSL